MKKIIIYTLTAFFAIAVSQVDAQKLGYLDSSTLLSEMPEVKQADSQLATLRKQLQKKGQQKAQELQTKYQELARKEKQGEIAPKALQSQAEQLKQEEMTLAQYEQDMQKQLSEKRQELLQPILDKVQVAIDEVAAEEGFTYVFDSSTGILLYADDAHDLTDKVRQKLGL